MVNILSEWPWNFPLEIRCPTGVPVVGIPAAGTAAAATTATGAARFPADVWRFRGAPGAAEAAAGAEIAAGDETEGVTAGSEEEGPREESERGEVHPMFSSM